MKTNLESKRQTLSVQLNQRMKSLAGQERELLCEIIQTIQEVYRHKVHLELGYTNLFNYLVEEIGYSNGSAYRRIEAARLVTEIPEMLEEIKSGDLKLTQVSLVQQAAREKSKTSSLPVTTQDKLEIIKQITQKNREQSQQRVAAFFDLPIKEQTKSVVQADESVRIELTIPKDLFDEMKQVQALISHAVPTPDWVNYIRYVTQAVLKQKTSVRAPKNDKAGVSEVGRIAVNTKADDQIFHGGNSPEVKKPTKAKKFDSVNSTLKTSTNELSAPEFSTVENHRATAPPAKPFSARQRKLLLKSTSGCQFRNPTTGKHCGSRWFLQIDHKHSRWAGGQSTLDNGQVLCGHHNRLKYAKEAGLKLSVIQSP